MPIIISDKIYIKKKIVTGDKMEHFMMIKGYIHQEDILT